MVGRSRSSLRHGFGGAIASDDLQKRAQEISAERGSLKDSRGYRVTTYLDAARERAERETAAAEAKV